MSQESKEIQERRALASSMAAAFSRAEPMPKMPQNISMDDAYVIQRELVAHLAPGAISGIKAGVTAPAAQKIFGVTHPLLGSLYAAGELASGAVFPNIDGLKLECEIGIIVDAQGVAKSAGPIVEIARMSFAHAEDVNGMNLVACNVAADRYVVGERFDIRENYDDISVRLTRNGEFISEAPVNDAMGGPHPALDWMLSEAKLRGMAVEQDMLFITGACGGIHEAQVGDYVADYGEFGRIEFTIT